MSDQTFERSALGGKDRDQLQAIANAVGLKGVSRMKKADLVEAIVGAGGGGAPQSNGTSRSGNSRQKADAAATSAATTATPTATTATTAPAARPPAAAANTVSSEASPEKKRIRSARASELDPIARIAAEEESLGRSNSNTSEEPLPIIRPRRNFNNATPSTKPDDATAPSSLEANGAANSSDLPTSALAPAPTPTVGTTGAGQPQQQNQARNQGRQQQNPGRQDRNQGDRNQGDRNQGDRNQGDRNQGDRNQGDRNQGDRNQGDRNQGDRNQGDRNQGDRNQGGRGQTQPNDDWDANSSAKSRRNRRRGKNKDGGREPQPDVDTSQYSGEVIDISGLLDLRDEGYGFLRSSGFQPGRNDSYVSASQVRKFSLRKGDHIQGGTRPASSTEKYPALLRVDLINGVTPDEARDRARFEDLTPLFPDMQLRLELPDSPLELTGRIIDLVSPIGKGQRALVVSPPKAGKTTIMKHIVYSIERNNPECHVMVLLVDERPEEVTDMKRHVLRAEVVSSTFDRPSDEHCHVAELTIERAKRLVEMGRDVVIVLDGITRLARAYNLSAPATGRIMSGGIDAGALYPPKRFFGAARNVEEGGSLTIIATALVETNSKMDEHIFEEFKGTGNLELKLERRLADRRIFPSIDVQASGTRQEQLLFERNQLQQVWKLRRVLAALDGDSGRDGFSGKGLELLIEKLRTTRTNAEFLNEIAKSAT